MDELFVLWHAEEEATRGGRWPHSWLRDRAIESGFPDFVERLYFVELDRRLFGVMAYSADDAGRQVAEALFLAGMGM